MIKYETLKVNYTKGDKGYLLYTESPYMYGEEIEGREHFRKLIINKFQKEDKILFNRFINSLIDNYWCSTLYYNTNKAKNERNSNKEKYNHNQINTIRQTKLKQK